MDSPKVPVTVRCHSCKTEIYSHHLYCEMCGGENTRFQIEHYASRIDEDAKSKEDVISLCSPGCHDEMNNIVDALGDLCNENHGREVSKIFEEHTGIYCSFCGKIIRTLN